MMPSIQKASLFIVLATSAMSLTQNAQAPQQDARTEATSAANELASHTDELTKQRAMVIALEDQLARKQADVASSRAAIASDQATYALSQERNIGINRFNDSVGETLLFVPAPETKPQDQALIAEDTKIMSRILCKTLREASLVLPGDTFFSQYADFRNTFLGGTDRDQTEVLYIADFGAVFFIEVGFPLAPSPQLQQVDQSEENTDTVWARTKQEIYAPENLKPVSGPFEGWNARHSPPKEEYDAEKVETLQNTLFDALKHATNMRCLKTNEWIILVVTSSDREETSTGYIYTLSSSAPGYGVGETTGQPVASQNTITSQSGSFTAVTLIIRAKKSDIDGFAAGNLDPDHFAKKAEVLKLSAIPTPPDTPNPEPAPRF
jgi:hypothetical protein